MERLVLQERMIECGGIVRRKEFAPSRKVLVALNAMIPLFGKASVLLVMTASCYLCTNDHSGW